ncbi:MAG: hypothetical protein ISS71_07990 [Phycisphaerae bacterium]|nr:hypothetical protein [Phycisphaerae bacterium]
MNRLSHQEQELILDFYFRCGQDEDIERGRDLIALNPGAAKLYAKLEETLADLDHVKYEPCPDNLVDLTIARLKLAASATTENPSRLHELIQQEQQTYTSKTVSATTGNEPAGQPGKKAETKPVYKFHHRIGELLATAAAILLILGILFPSAGAMRQHYYRVACADNLRQIGQGFSTFANDHNDQLSETAMQAGSPWWKIGYQGPESHSNTRYPFQLVKHGYVKGRVFICRGNAGCEPLQYDPSKINSLLDFPSRNNISYSFMLFCDKNANAAHRGRKVIAGDLNPVFREIPSEQSIYAKLNEFEKILLNQQLRQMLSSSHSDKGQNILHCDGSVEWIQVRIVNDDDIYTIQGVDAYIGKETPTDINDIFLAP